MSHFHIYYTQAFVLQTPKYVVKKHLFKLLNNTKYWYWKKKAKM